MKFKEKKSTKPTLSDKIADALTIKARADIEDDQVFGTKPQTLSRVDFNSSESEDEAVISDFRKRSVNLLSEISKKYEGKVVTKKDLAQESESSDTEDNQHTTENGNKSSDSEGSVKKPSQLDSDEDSEQSEKAIGASKEDSDIDSDDAESDDYSITKLQKASSDDNSNDDDDVDDDDDEGYDISQMSEPMKEVFEHVKKKNVSEEAKKGTSVRNQLLIWEGLLEMRIHLQRCVNTANQMPMPDTFNDLKKNKDFVDEANATKTNVANVLDKFLSLQNTLLKKFPDTKNLVANQTDKQSEEKQDNEEIPSDTDNEEIPSDTEPESDTEVKEKAPEKTKPVARKRKLDEYEKDIAASHKSFKTFRDTMIQKWNDKTRIATATNIKNAPTNTILQQISYILSDKEKLIKRTQLKRSEYDIIGYRKPEIQEDELNPTTKGRKDDDEYISEIFDDSDFYHQLLRELIECKSADISDPVQLSRQWIALQQMRSKMKRKVDTKATKGRKIKYVVHNKLVNFMAPEKSNTWTDDSTNELYSSIFGKMFEHNNIGLNANVGNFKLKD